MPSLFDPIRIGPLELPNRIFMSPLTRGRSSKEGVPNSALMAKYYAQRATAGLIVSEATGVNREGLGWAYAPGIWNDAQVEAWQPIVQAVVGDRLKHTVRASHAKSTALVVGELEVAADLPAELAQVCLLSRAPTRSPSASRKEQARSCPTTFRRTAGCQSKSST